MCVFKWQLLLVMEITIREINSDLVIVPGQRKSQLQVLDVGDRSFKDHVEAQKRAQALAPTGKLKPNATGFVRGLGKCRSCGKRIAVLHAVVGETEDSLF